MNKNFTKASELYEVPVCELISELEVGVLCESTGEQFEAGEPWDGTESWE